MNANHEPEPRTLNPLFPMNEKLTAYALNELPPEERAEFELQLKADPTLRKQAEEMQAFCAMLTDEVAEEEAKGDTLTPEQRVSVMRAFTTPNNSEEKDKADEHSATKKVVRPFWRHPAFLVPTALAACVTFVLVWQAEQLDRMESQILSRTEIASRKVDFLPSGGTPAKDAEGAASPVVDAQPKPTLPPVQIPGVKSDVVLDTSSSTSLPVNTATLGGKVESGSGTIPLLGTNTYGGGVTITVNGGAPTVALGDAAVSNEGKAQMGKDLTPVVAAEPLIANNSSVTLASGGVISGSGAMATPAPLRATTTYRGVNAPSAPPPLSTGVGSGTAMPAKPAAGTNPFIEAAGSTQTAGLNVTSATTTTAQNNITLASTVAPSTRAAGEATKAKQAAGGFNTLADNISGANDDSFDNNLSPIPSDKTRRERSNESYTRIQENPFLFVTQQPLSTFSIDVDTASYANVRRFLNEGQRPPADAVRLEELINYFPYAYEGPSDGKPFGVMVDVAETPWQPLHRLVRVALKGREVQEDRGPANFVFLVDVSGSMDSSDKLPLVQRSLQMLTKQLGEKDRVALVVYAGSSGLVLPSTEGTEKATIMDAIANLKAGGSTNGASGINLAYQEAAKHFVKGGVNRVILCTDGDFNVGVSSPEELQKLIAEKAKSRIFLSVLGFGTGNLKDRTMETLADKGNGNYAYIDSLSEARKVLVEQMNGTLVTIAKDVKIQVEFNPAEVSAYRLLGYENRILAKEDFNNDKKDAGEIGAGHTVTALYEVVPASVKYPDGKPLVDDLKYAANAPQPAAPAPAAAAAPASPAMEKPATHEMMTVKLRYKQPEGDKSDLLEVPVTDKEQKLADSSRDFQFAASVAGFGMLLRGSEHAGELTWDMVREMALRGKGEDTLGYRGEFLQLIDKASGLASPPPQ